MSNDEVGVLPAPEPTVMDPWIKPCSEDDHNNLKLAALLEPFVQRFACEHLPPHLADVSVIFLRAACSIVTKTPRTPDRTVALRKLWEAKNAAVYGCVNPR